MVLPFYNLKEQPFGVTPDPRYFYLSLTHREALASVVHAVAAGRGFSALIAKPGMGKTTILFNFLTMLQDYAKTVFLFQSQASPHDLLRNLLGDLGIDDDGSDIVRLHRKLNECLLNEARQGKQLVVVIDEAQNLEDPVLEVVRMLSNFETSRDKLMHLILAGQPQLAEKLANPRLLQLKQRISIIARLTPFNAEETKSYIEHRLRVAGFDFSKPLFAKRAYQMIADYTNGVPREINNLCFNAISIGCVTKRKTIDVDILEEVVRDLDLNSIGVGPEANPAYQEATPSWNTGRTKAPHRLLFERWILRSAMGLMLIALVSWPFLGNHRQFAAALLFRASQVFTRSTTVAPLPVSAAVETPAAPAEPQAATVPSPSAAPAVASSESISDSKVVRVAPGDSIFKIAIREFGKYDPRIVARIRELNPWLKNPMEIRNGQEIRIPTLQSVSEKLQRAAGELRTASATGAEIP
jgi:type II secretory pathway predicted ATPase ExeA